MHKKHLTLFTNSKLIRNVIIAEMVCVLKPKSYAVMGLVIANNHAWLMKSERLVRLREILDPQPNIPEMSEWQSSWVGWFKKKKKEKSWRSLEKCFSIKMQITMVSLFWYLLLYWVFCFALFISRFLSSQFSGNIFSPRRTSLKLSWRI